MSSRPGPVQSVAFRATLQAKLLSHNYFGTEHLLLEVLGGADREFTTRLHSVGLSGEPVRACATSYINVEHFYRGFPKELRQLAEDHPLGSEIERVATERPMTDEAVRAVIAAESESEPDSSPERALLRGILAQEKTNTHTLLVLLGVDETDLRTLLG